MDKHSSSKVTKEKNVLFLQQNKLERFILAAFLA